MRKPSPKLDLSALERQTVEHLIQSPPTPDEIDWVASLQSLFDHPWTDHDAIEARRLYWETRLGFDRDWPTPIRALFADPAWQRLMDQYEAALV